MKRGAALLAALLLAGCGLNEATSNGFSAKPPGGWKDATDPAETRTGTDFEAVFEGTTVEGVAPVITISRVEAAKGRTAAAAAAAARTAVDRRFDEADPTPVISADLGGEPALRFDYTTGEKRARYITARRGGHLFAVTLQAAEADFDRQLKVFDAYLAGWRWD